MAVAPQQFGSLHTEKKLKTVEAYLQRFTMVLKNTTFTTLYVDACAGSGASMPKSSDLTQPGLFALDEIIDGSAKRALCVDPPFQKYLFNDTKRKNVKSLLSMVEQHHSHLSDRVKVTNSTADGMLNDLCRDTDWKSTRAVVFLDPFGMQIDFSTVKMLADTKAVDLWYLVPVFAMSRQIKNTGEILEQGGDAIDRILGTTKWRDSVATAPPVLNLFGEVQTPSSKVVGSEWFEGVAIDQLRSVFRGGVSSLALPLGRNGLHEFSLVFACANPSQKAHELALRLANAVLRTK